MSSHEMLGINVLTCLYLTFWFILKKCHRSVTTDFIAFAVGACQEELTLRCVYTYWRPFGEICKYLLFSLGLYDGAFVVLHLIYSLY